jgi:hypothetical protein
MRPAHIRLLAVAGALTVVVGVAAAMLVGRDDPAPLQPASAASPTTIAIPTGQDAAKGGAAPANGTGKNGTGNDDPAPGERAARAAAVSFMRGLGMTDPVAATYRGTGQATAEVGIHPRAGEGGRHLDKVTTLVQLHRYANGWVATGAKAVGAIEVDQPLPFARILSPLTVSGLSSAFEGTVHVRVTEDRRGADRVLGTGFVNGGATGLAPFSGPITFVRPTGDAGWVIFSGDTGTGDGVFSATAVRIRFAGDQPAPRISMVTTDPPAVGSARLVTLHGTGTFTVRLQASGADEVRFLLVPSGTGGRPHARLLGVDADGDRSWSLSWRYPDESFHGHLLIQASGPGGTVEYDGIAVQHP